MRHHRHPRAAMPNTGVQYRQMIRCSGRPWRAAAELTRSAVPYTVSRHSANFRESAEFPTGVKEALTLLGKSRRPIYNPIGVSFTRGIASVSLVFKRRMQDSFSARF